MVNAIVICAESRNKFRFPYTVNTLAGGSQFLFLYEITAQPFSTTAKMPMMPR